MAGIASSSPDNIAYYHYNNAVTGDPRGDRHTFDFGPVLEEYFSRSLGMTLLTLGIMIVLLTGSVPLTSSISDILPATNAAVTTEANDPKAPYAVPTLTISTLYHGAMAFFCYARYVTVGQASFALGSLGFGALFAVGGWCILFGTASGRISRKTGADKRTSNFPFGNSESASAKKRAAKRA
ncbi:substrate-specific transmembrane transporter protein [Rutstroemia sp. NJR-2017a WRK4]|nr:substrate-specific transmembrane transporter protein [Rutstroemia sp. NJR-2017a WRK4]PQE14911.1 substrate-specific transmembrane transporter protein [Rutstroemia sp. NJR-2017a WRK4]